MKEKNETKENINESLARELENLNRTKQPELKIGRIIATFCVVLAIILLFLGSFYTIKAGERGVLLTFGKPDMDAKIEGLHMKIPIAQSIVKMNVQTQKYEVAKTSAASKDLQTVTTDVALNYYITPETVPELYQKIGVNYQDKVISPAVQEVVKASTAQYTAEELITKRPEVKNKIDDGLRERLKAWDILVQSIAITNFDFSPQFNTAIEQKVTAEQNALAAKNKLEQVKFEAQQRIEEAQGKATAMTIEINALKENRDILQLRFIEKWSGNLPAVYGGAMPLISADAFMPNQSK